MSFSASCTLAPTFSFFAQEEKQWLLQQAKAREASLAEAAHARRIKRANSVAPDDARPELTRLYLPGGSFPDLDEYAAPKAFLALELFEYFLSIVILRSNMSIRYMNKLVEIRVPAKFLTKNNPEVRAMQLWGHGIYTSDSDVVTMLQVNHTKHAPLCQQLRKRLDPPHPVTSTHTRHQ